jgi:two-component system, sensor histidine kinase and response regulator
MVRALVLDDNTSNLEVIKELLSLEGVECVTLRDYHKLDAILDQHFDIVFLDLEMPTTSGYSVLKKLRTMANFQQIPIIAYTVYVSELQRMRESGFDGLLAKPLDIDKFPTQLKRLLNGERLWETL